MKSLSLFVFQNVATPTSVRTLLSYNRLTMKSTFALFMLAVMVTVAHCVDIEEVYARKKNPSVLRSRSSSIIEIMIVIDTDRLTDDFRDKTVSRNPDRPTPINHNYAFMMTNNKNVISGQATADLHISAVPGDFINWHGVSESNNFDNQIIVYGIKHRSDSLSDVTLGTRKKENVFPRNNNIRQLEGVKTNNYVIFVSVRESGIVNYEVKFGVYTTNRGNGRRELFGYFTWDPVITIQGGGGDFIPIENDADQTSDQEPRTVIEHYPPRSGIINI